MTLIQEIKNLKWFNLINELKALLPKIVASSGGIPDAPIDGSQYARQDGAWSEVTGGVPQNLQSVLDNGKTWTPDSSTYTTYFSIDDPVLGTDDALAFVTPLSTLTVGSAGFSLKSGAGGDSHNLIYFEGDIPIDPSGSLFFKLPNDKVVTTTTDPTPYILATRDEIPTGTQRQITGFGADGKAKAITLGWKQLSDLPSPPPFLNGVYVGTAFKPDGSALFAFLELAIDSPDSIAKPNSIPIYQAGIIGNGGGTLPVQDPVNDLDAVNKRSLIPLINGVTSGDFTIEDGFSQRIITLTSPSTTVEQNVILPAISDSIGSTFTIINDAGTIAHIKSKTGANDIWDGGTLKNDKFFNKGITVRVINDGINYKILKNE